LHRSLNDPIVSRTTAVRLVSLGPHTKPLKSA
jgi:hypothetical protein